MGNNERGHFNFFFSILLNVVNNIYFNFVSDVFLINRFYSDVLFVTCMHINVASFFLITQKQNVVSSNHIKQILFKSIFYLRMKIRV